MNIWFVIFGSLALFLLAFGLWAMLKVASDADDEMERLGRKLDDDWEAWP